MNLLSGLWLLFVANPTAVVTTAFPSSGLAAPPTAPTARPYSSRTLVWQAAGGGGTTTSSSSTSSKERKKKPWEFGRFLRQSSRFIPVLQNPFQKANPGTTIVQPGRVLWEPSSSSSSSSSFVFSFGELDDVVMGGASSSTFDDPTGTWTGTVTDANNGGFIGIRSFPSLALDMRNCRGVELTFKGGSGQRYKIGMRDTSDFNGIVWTKSVDIGSKNSGGLAAVWNTKKNDITTIRIPFQELVPTRFARIIHDQEFQQQHVAGIQIAYSKFEYNGDLNPNFVLGDIRLQILQVKAY